jgi:hypothetical protein
VDVITGLNPTFRTLLDLAYNLFNNSEYEKSLSIVKNLKTLFCMSNSDVTSTVLDPVLISNVDNFEKILEKYMNKELLTVSFTKKI